MVSKLSSLIHKNLTLLLRTRSSAFIVIFGPLLLILLLGLAFNTSHPYAIRVAVYAESTTALTESVTQALEEEFTVLKAQTREQCLTGIKQGSYHVCAFFPAGLDIKNGGDVTFYVDQTKINLVYAVVNAVRSVVTETNKELGMQLTTSIIGILHDTQKKITDHQILATALKEDLEKANQDLDVLRTSLTSMQLQTVDAGDSFSILESDLKKLNSSSLIPQFNDAQEAFTTANVRLQNAYPARQKSLQAASSLTTTLTADLAYSEQIAQALSTLEKNIQALQVGNPETVVSPLGAQIEPVAGTTSNLGYLFPTLLGLIILFVSMLLASTLEVRERLSPIQFRNYMTPTSDFTFIFGNFLTTFFVVLLQLFVLFSVALFFFTEEILLVLVPLIIPLFLSTAVFILLGMVLGLFFKSEETVTLGAISIGFIFLFFSSALLPVESLSPFFLMLTSFNPFYVVQTVFTKIFLFHLPLTDVLPSLLLLCGMIVFLFALVVLLKKVHQRAGS